MKFCAFILFVFTALLANAFSEEFLKIEHEGSVLSFTKARKCTIVEGLEAIRGPDGDEKKQYSRKIMIDLVGDDIGKLAKFTSTHQGKRVSVFVFGILIGSPTLNRSIDHGSIELTIGSKATFEKIRAALETCGRKHDLRIDDDEDAPEKRR